MAKHDPLSDYRDEDGQLRGFQAGKALALLDWRHRKEIAETNAMVHRLQSRNSMRREAQTHPDRVRERHARWQKKHPELVLEQHRRRKKRRLAKGLCRDCGKRPHIVGQQCCEPCRAKGRAATRKNKLKRDERAQTEGLCNRCLKRSSAPEKKACTPCLEKKNQRRAS